MNRRAESATRWAVWHLLAGLAAACLPAAAVGPPGGNPAGTPTSKAAAAARPAAAMNVDIRLDDWELVTQEGKPVRLKSGIIGDKLVAVTFIYTSCTTVCPIASALFAKLQLLLGERLGREVMLVTLTLDPATDIPARMQRQAEKFKARPGWVYLTGEKPNVDAALRQLGAYSADFQNHAPMVLVGDGRTGAWRRVNGLASPERLLGLIDELQAMRADDR